MGEYRSPAYKQAALADAGTLLFRPMGRIAVSGRASPVVVWEPMPEVPEEERLRLSQLWTRFDTGDTAALDELEQICLTKDKDAALANLVQRLREVGPGGCYTLKEK